MTSDPLGDVLTRIKKTPNEKKTICHTKLEAQGLGFNVLKVKGTLEL